MAVTITQALWGSGTDAEGVDDVTNDAQELYTKGTTTFHASREQWNNDPAFKKTKALLIQWTTSDGGKHFGICSEGDSITLPKQ